MPNDLERDRHGGFGRRSCLHRCARHISPVVADRLDRAPHRHPGHGRSETIVANASEGI